MAEKSLRINGLKEVRDFMNNLPKEINKEVKDKGILELAKNLQIRIKRRAPMGPTRWLKRSVMIEKNGKFVSVVVNAHYAMAIEEGFNKKVSIPVEYLEQHSSMPDAPGQRVTNPEAWITLKGKPHPFITPAIKSWRPKINEILLRSVEKALSNAGGNK